MATDFTNDMHDSLAVEVLLATLGPALGGRDAVITRAGPGELIELAGHEGLRVIADDVPRISRPLLLKAWHHVHSRARDTDAVPVLVVSRLSGTLRQLAEEEQVNWVDLAGNAHVVDRRLFVHIEGRARRQARGSGGVDPFAPRSTNIVRQLLADPRRTWRQKELVDATGLSQPQTSKVLTALHELALVGSDENGRLGLDDPEGLLDAWADAHRYARQRLVSAHLSGDGMALARDLHGRLVDAGVEHWFTGLPAAWAYDRFARFRLVSVYVDGDPEQVCAALRLRETRRGANVHLIASDGQRFDIGAAQPDSVPCAHPAQVYVDLRGLPERANEAAEHLRPLALRGPWT